MSNFYHFGVPEMIEILSEKNDFIFTSFEIQNLSFQENLNK